MSASLQRWMPSGVRWTHPDGGYFLWLEFPESVDAMELHRLAIQRGVSLSPGPIFSPSHAFPNCMRLNFGHPWTKATDDTIRILSELAASSSVPAEN